MEGFYPLPRDMTLPPGSRFPWCSLEIEGSVDVLRKAESPAEGWSAYLDYSQGHRLRSGGMEDQPAIWVSVLRVCRGIASDIESFIARQRTEDMKRRTRSPGLHR